MIGKIFILLFIILCSCTPVQYIYIPPQNFEGKVCVNNCLAQKSQCLNSCSTIELQCKQLEMMGKYLDAGVGRQPSFSSSACDGWQCQSNCEHNYKVCFTNCGGKIFIEER